MKGVSVGVALLAALAIGVPAAHAQNPYSVGGYLERPDTPDEDAGPQEGASPPPRRQRQIRPAGQEEQAPSAGVTPQTQTAPQATGATQSGQQRRPSTTGSGQGTASQQARRAPGADPTPHQQQRPDEQRPPATAQDDAPPAQPRNRPVNAAVSTRPQQPAPEAAAIRETTDLAIPPVPMRRPKFAGERARPVMTALATPAPTPSETEPQDSTGDRAHPAKTEVAAKPAAIEPAPTTPEPAATPVADAPPAPEMPLAGQSVPVAAPVAPPAVEPKEAAVPEASTMVDGAAAENATAPQAQAAADAQPQGQAVIAERQTAPSTHETAAELPSMMASAEVASEPAESETATKSDRIIAAQSPQPVEPQAVETPAPIPTEATRMEETAPPTPVDAMSLAEQDSAANAAPANASQTDTVAAKNEAETLETATADRSDQSAPTTVPSSAAAPVASPAAAPAPQVEVPAAAPVVQDVIPDLPVRPVRVAAATETATPVPQQPPGKPSGQIDRMIGQMMIVGFRGLTPEEAWPQKLAAQIKSGTIGGVLFMSHNVQSPQQLKTLTGFLQKAKSDIPVLFAVDQEGGIVQRLSAEKGFQTYPTAGKIGQSNDPLTAYSVYRRLAAELAQNGFNLNLGPVVDLLRNDASPIIAGKERSFGSQPKHVAAFAKAFCMAHQDEGVLTVLKHFPGHGSTPFDTHVQPVDVGHSWTEDEIVPYRELIASRTAHAVMSGHIANPAMADEPGLPASLSAKAIRGALRGDLGFTGIVISDDLEMGAIRARYSIEDSAVKAIKAGNDIVILSNQHAPNPDLPERVAAAIKKAVDTGELRREDLQAAYDRILGFKQRLPGVSVSAPAAAGKRASADRQGRAASAR